MHSDQNPFNQPELHVENVECSMELTDFENLKPGPMLWKQAAPDPYCQSEREQLQDDVDDLEAQVLDMEDQVDRATKEMCMWERRYKDIKQRIEIKAEMKAEVKSKKLLDRAMALSDLHSVMLNYLSSNEQLMQMWQQDPRVHQLYKKGGLK